MAKAFQSDKQYSAVLDGAAIQPILATLSEVVKSLEAQKTQLDEQCKRLQARIIYLEELRDAVYHSKQFVPSPTDEILDEEQY